jgi:hypothetical protein
MPMKKVREAEMKVRFWKLKITAGVRSTRNWPIWHISSVRSANPVCIFLPYGFPLSAMRLTTHREGQYDLRDSSSVSI